MQKFFDYVALVVSLCDVDLLHLIEKILLDRRYDETLSIYSMIAAMTS